MMSEAPGISTLEIGDGGIAVLTIDSPPVNALGHAVRIAIADGVNRALADPATRAFILICGGRTFFAGADITEIGKPILPPLLKDVMTALEASDKPSIAAIHGTALGGGFEIALACHFRIATAKARVGLPEAALGLLPGAGGTQRVPRLIGIANAIDMIGLGKSYTAREALQIGLIDAVSEGDLRADAIAYARHLLDEGATLRRVRDMPADVDAATARSLAADFRTDNPALFRHLKAPAAILDAIIAAVELPFEDGLLREKQLSGELIASPESAAQRHIFFAERAAAKIPDLPKDAAPASLHSVAATGDTPASRALARVVESAGVALRPVGEADIILKPGAIDTTDDRTIGVAFHGDPADAPVIEILRGPATSAASTAQAVALARKLDKIPLLSIGAKDSVIATLLAAGQDAGQTLIAEGAHARDIAAALEEQGFDGRWAPPSSGDAGTGAIPAQIIVDRIVAAVAAAGQALLDAGQVYRSGDIDTALVKAAGWPLHSGGPMFWQARKAG